MGALRWGIAAAGAVLCVFLAGSTAWAQVSPLRLAVLPSARSGQVGETLTYFGTIINTGEEDLTCREAVGNIQVGDEFVSIGVIPIDDDGAPIPFDVRWPLEAGATQRLLIRSDSAAPTAGRARTRIRCLTPPGPDRQSISPILFNGVNDFSVNFSADPQPDIIMIGDTVSGDGVARVGASGPRAALLVVSAVNIGAPADELLLVPAVTGFTALNGLGPTVCETGADGVCLAPESDRAVVENWATGEIRFFAVRLRVPPAFGIPLYPGQLRLALHGFLPEPGEGPASVASLEPVIAGFQSFGTGTSTAVEAEFQADASPIFTPGGVGTTDSGISYACRARRDDEVEVPFSQVGGNRGEFSPDGHGALRIEYELDADLNLTVTGFGFVGDARPAETGISDFYLSTFSLSGAGSLPASGFSATIPASLTVHGDGAPLGVTFDGVQDIAATFDLSTGGLTVSYPGDSGLFSSGFGAPGRMRCAPMPPRPGETGDASAAAGAFSGADPYVQSLTPEEERQAEIEADIRRSEQERMELLQRPTNLEEEDPYYAWRDRGGEIDFATLFLAGFSTLNSNNESGPHLGRPSDEDFQPIGIVHYGRLREEGGAMIADCIVLALTDSTHPDEAPGEQERMQDARVLLFTRDGSSQGLAQDIRDCIP